MNTEALIVAALFAPLAGAAGIVACGRHPNLREGVTLVTAGAVFLLVLQLLPLVMAGGAPAVTLVQTLPGLAIAFAIEPLGMLFALVASFLWIITSLYSIGYMRAHNEANQTRFYAFFAIAISVTLGIAFAANLFTLFLCYEVLTLCTFPLVTHAGSDEARRAGRMYLGILLGTSIGLQLLAILWTWTLAGTLDFTPGGILAGHATPAVAAVLLALYVFGVGKAALMPFHRWLPAAMVAPTPVSALLHAVAVVKAGVFTLLKIAVYIFGPDFLAGVVSRPWLLYLAAFTILAASLVALSKDNLKARLAYSTISQLSYIVLGLLLANHWGVLGGASHILMHAFGKITLFFCAGAILVTAHKTEISEMDGLGRTMPVTMTAFLIGALSVAGLPPTGGLWSKWYLALGTLESGQYLLLAVLLVSSLLNVGYLLSIPARAFFRAPPAGANDGNGIREAPAPALAALCITALGCFVLFLWPQPALNLLRLALP